MGIKRLHRYHLPFVINIQECPQSIQINQSDATSPAPLTSKCRPCTNAKFLQVSEQRLFIRGVSYGSFVESLPGIPFPPSDIVQLDFTKMRAIGINSVRIYDIPPMWLLDMAAEEGLWVILGIPWPQHLCLDQTGRREAIQQVYSVSQRYANHPAVLMCCVGNEIPSSIVRWYGKEQTENFIGNLCAAVRDAAPDTLVTYANYPTTEYLELPFLDVVGFNVYLHEQEAFQKYLAHLQIVAGDRPLLLTELGMDSLHHGEDAQAEFFLAQLRDVFDCGLCGALTFSWTDDWFRGGKQITDWSFGLVDKDRTPKRAYYAVGETLAETPFQRCRDWPRISVVVAAYNAAATLDDCLSSLMQLTYPDYEVIVVNDGSTDQTGAIADRFECAFGERYADGAVRMRVLHGPNGGLSTARNKGLEASTGEIIAYTDADCRADPDWLYYLALALLDKPVAGAGGPNLVPRDDELVAQCVAKAPGGPIHILLDDEIAEHIPGCNMAFWRTALEEVGGFHPDYCVAGDDVDICWRLQAQGYQIGFAPSAVVWHHRRPSIRAYLRQQIGYGRSEAILEDHHPHKFNQVGQVRWFGSIYGLNNLLPLRRRYQIYYGKFGSAPFQALENTGPNWWMYIPQMPEWYLLIILLAVATPIVSWSGVAALMALGVTLASAVYAGQLASLPGDLSCITRLRCRALITLLHLLQPVTRAWGRLQGGLGPLRLTTRAWTRRLPEGPSWQQIRNVLWPLGVFEVAFWTEKGLEVEGFLYTLVNDLHRRRLHVDTGTGWEPWDLLINGYIGERAYLFSTVEYHGGSRCLLRLRATLQTSRWVLGISFTLLAMAGWLLVFMPDVTLLKPLRWLPQLAALCFLLLWLIWLGLRRIWLAVYVLQAVEQTAHHAGLVQLKHQQAYSHDSNRWYLGWQEKHHHGQTTSIQQNGKAGYES